MSESIQVKKRGRPKKAVPATDTAADILTELPSSATKRVAQSKKGASGEIPNLEGVPAKKSRRKTTKSTTTLDDASVPPAKISNSSTTPNLITNKPKSAGVLDDQVEAKGQLIASESASDTDIQMQATPTLPTRSAVLPASSDTSESSVSGSRNPHPAVVQQEPALSTTVSDPQRSSFLSSFLDKDYQEETPAVSESSKISDRSAFKQQQISFDDIVKGDGVSTVTRVNSDSPDKSPILTSLSSSQKPKTASVTKNSSFAPLKIQAFPDAPRNSVSPATITRLNVPPESFSSKSFMAFKESASLQARAKSAPVRPPPPAPNTSSQFRKAYEQAPQPAPAAKVEYTKLSYDQIKKLPEYRAKRWFWTKMMVGIPFSLVAGYALWGRLQDWQEQRRVAMNIDGSGPRQRGVLNSKSPNVGANGSI